MSDSEDDAEEIKRSKKRKNTFIDDLAELSGSDPDEAAGSSEEEDDEDVNDYLRDGFVVDDIVDEEDDDDDLQDSDESEEDDDYGYGSRRSVKKKGLLKKKKRRIKKQKHRLDEDDMLLIQEARGGGGPVKEKILFEESSDEDDLAYRRKKKLVKKKKAAGDDFDDSEEDLDEDENLRNRGGVTQEQITEATEIFGDMSTFLKAKGESDDEGGNKYKEHGVGVDTMGDSISNSSEDEEDLFADDDSEKRTEADLRRKKRAAAKKEKQQKAQKKRLAARKARLRRAFEPVQLIENFCTDRDDAMRIKDAPERFFDWNIPFHGAAEEEEEEEAMWIMARIPPIAAEFFAPPMQSDEMDEDDAMAKKQRSILDSIIHSLRFMHNDKLEPDFIQRYRADIVTSPAVRNNLYLIFDQDAEWDRLTTSRKKVDVLLTKVTTLANEEKKKLWKHEFQSNLHDELIASKNRLDEAVSQEIQCKEELAQIQSIKKEEVEEEDEDLFGSDNQNEKKTQKSQLQTHLETLQELVKERAARVSELETQITTSNYQNADSEVESQAKLSMSKMCQDKLWSLSEYHQYLSMLTEEIHVTDVARYFQLISEGNEAILNKLSLSSSKRNRRSRSFVRDYYRTCVVEGLRSICYKYVMSPMLVGIVLEDNITLADGFQYNSPRKVAGLNDDEEKDDDFRIWKSPVINDLDPMRFANELVGSGELVLVSNSTDDGPNSGMKDPLKGCRHVAAMELSSEPRIRRYLRNIYRKNALLTTYPTPKGLHDVDAFSEFYGLHLIRHKPLKEHFPADEKDHEEKYFGLSLEERKELDEEANNRERESCVQYLRILKGERAKVLFIKIHLPFINDDYGEEWYRQENMSRQEMDLSTLLNPLKNIYIPSDDTVDWCEERNKILDLTLKGFLLPQFETEARRDLRDAAHKFGVESAALSLQSMAMEGPYRPTHLIKDNRFLSPTPDFPIVGVCDSGSSSKDATYLACVSDRGESIDHLAVPNGQRIGNEEVQDKVMKFLISTRPAAVVVGTSSGFQARALARILTEIVNRSLDKWFGRFIQGEDEDDDDFDARQKEFRSLYPGAADDDDDEQWNCNVDLVEDNVSQLFGRSVRGKKEFPDATINLKCAISIARHAQNPLAELCYAWSVASDAGTFGTEMLFLNIHPLQQLLPKNLLLKEYERVLCHTVADVGVDVNACCVFDHLHGMLQFVPGLGSRKSASLRQSILRIGGVIESRRALLAKRIVGPTVYNNAVAFLRIREKDQLLGQHLHPLDDTRLHPDVYHKNKWAVKIAIDAMEPERPENSEEFAIKSLRDAMANSQEQVRKLFEMTKAEWEDVYGPTFNIPAWDPKKNVPVESWRDNVEELDLETFAHMIDNDGMGKWLSHLLMIKWEFRLPFIDPRKPMEPLTGDKLFRLLTGENDFSLRPGREVTGKVIRNTEYGSRVKLLEGDIPAWIPIRSLSDDHVDTPEDVVRVSNVVTAIISEVKKDHVTLDLSLRISDFQKLPSYWKRPDSLPPLDEKFVRYAAERIEAEKSDEREAHLVKLRLRASKLQEENQKNRTGRITRRACAHPAFRNAKNDEIDRELREAGEAVVGEALIRPSNQNCDSLAVHWVVRPGVVKVIEVIEEDKDADTSIGNRLKLKNEVYESIDELLGRYFAPMNDRVNEVNNYRKFIDLSEHDVDMKLVSLKKGNPKSIPYLICWNEQHPGYASLRFMLSKTPRNYSIGLTPDGYMWQNTLFKNLDRLIGGFKRNPAGPQDPKKPISSRPSAIPPKKSPNYTLPSSDIVMKPSRWDGGASSNNLIQPPAPSISVASKTNGWGSSSNPAPPPPHPPPESTRPSTTSWNRWGANNNAPDPPPPPPGFVQQFSQGMPPQVPQGMAHILPGNTIPAPGIPLPPSGYPPPFPQPPPPGVQAPAVGFPPTQEHQLQQQ